MIAVTYACTCRKGSSSFCEDIILKYATPEVFYLVREWIVEVVVIVYVGADSCLGEAVPKPAIGTPEPRAWVRVALGPTHLLEILCS
jgi:hypothetical protein